MTATDKQIREWARDNGIEDVPLRGPVPPGIRQQYDDDHLEPADSDFGDVSEPGAPPEDVTEKRPRNISTPRAAPAARWRARRGGAAKKKARHPRVPVDDLIAGLWRGLAGFARPLPATSRLLKLQAPVAGVILEDTVKGSVVDRWLQPLARTSKAGEAMFVLAAPPLMVAAIEMDPSKAPFIMPVLRESMLRWCKIAGPKMADALKREREFEEQFGEDVDELLAMLFDKAADPAGDEAMIRETQEAMAV